MEKQRLQTYRALGAHTYSFFHLGSSPSAEQILTNTAKQLEQEQRQQNCKGNSFARRWRTKGKTAKE
jgi:hypothetical protein